VTVPSYAAKRDTVEPEVIRVFQEAGWSVVPLSGAGLPDLLLAPPGERPILCEVKTGNAKLTKVQENWHRNWKGEPVPIVRNAAQARKLVRMLTLAADDRYALDTPASLVPPVEEES
jgi:hypothetical protein